MSKYNLILKPYKFNKLKVELLSELPVFNLKRANSIINNNVYADLTYDFELEGDCISLIDSINVYINGYKINCFYNNGKIVFNDKNRRFFLDFCGFAQICIEIFIDGNIEMYYTDYLHILIKDDISSVSIRQMANYIYKYQDKLLMDDNMYSSDIFDFIENGKKSPEVYINIFRKIINEYKYLYEMFLTNSKFKLYKDYKTDNFEKLTYVGSKNINYIIQHPDELRKTEIGKGFTVKNKNFIPNRTLIGKNIEDLDIYENQIVLGFLPTLINGIERLRNKSDEMLQLINGLYSNNNGYQTSAGLIFNVPKKNLEKILRDIESLENELYVIYNNYIEILPVTKKVVNFIPESTHIFKNVGHYNRIYQCIVDWFNLGIYNFEKEKFLIPLLCNSKLYEYYILLKLYNYIGKKGFKLENKNKFLYKQQSKFYNETPYCNTFEFKKHDMKVTLYYQPVLSIDKRHKNNITLIRNTTLSIRSDNEKHDEIKGNYYLPDFLIKISPCDSNNSYYSIIDAKFSTATNIKKHYFPSLTYKYLFSLTSLEYNDKILGLCAIGGKSDIKKDNFIESIYHKNIPDSYTPYADILSIIENGDENNEDIHMSLLDELFQKYFSSVLNF